MVQNYAIRLRLEGVERRGARGVLTMALLELKLESVRVWLM